MSSAMRTTLQTVPESLATDHVTNSKVRLLTDYIKVLFMRYKFVGFRLVCQLMKHFKL